jgi:hypothetical protein
MADPDELLRAAERVAGILEERRIEAIVIGAVALAAHGYVRFTEDVDLGISVDPRTLPAIAEALRAGGFAVSLHEPDGQDPLGGVIDVTGSFGVVQIVNFGGRFPAVIDAGVAEATVVARPGSRLRIVPIPQLVALKLYAGGRKSQADIVELLARNRETDLGRVREVCRGYRLKGLEPLIAEATGESGAGD